MEVLTSDNLVSTLPEDLVTAMLANFTGVTSVGSGIYAVDCSQTSLSGTLDFGFGNTIINVPFHQFVSNRSLCFAPQSLLSPDFLSISWF
jgi:hypothetical protein